MVINNYSLNASYAKFKKCEVKKTNYTLLKKGQFKKSKINKNNCTFVNGIQVRNDCCEELKLFLILQSIKKHLLHKYSMVWFSFIVIYKFVNRVSLEIFFRKI